MPAASPPPRPPRQPRLASVVEVERLTPRMVRVVLGGQGLEGFEAGEFTDRYVKLQLPPPGAEYGPPFEVEAIRATHPRERWPRTRAVTVRAWDAARARLTIDFVTHGAEGVAGPWAAAARPGDRLQLVGPGGAYAPDPGVDWHLMVGDASALPAIATSLERVPAGTPAQALVQVAGPEEELELASSGDLRLRWLHGEAEGLLVEAVEALEFPPGSVQAFVHGEAGAVRAVRRHLVVDRGLPVEALSASGYWKRARTDEGWRADKPEWNRLVASDSTAAGG